MPCTPLSSPGGGMKGKGWERRKKKEKKGEEGSEEGEK